MADTTPIIRNIPQEQQDYKALQEYIRLGNYDAVAKAVHCSKSTAYERVQRALGRAKPGDNPNAYISNRSDF